MVDAVDYHRSWGELPFAMREQLAWQTLADAVAQLHHRLIYDLNKRRYRTDEPLTQSRQGQPGDFIDHYDVRLEFAKEADQKAFEFRYPDPKEPIPPPVQLTLDLQDPRNIYAPLLLREGQDKPDVMLRYKGIAISPDALNPGERKFVQDLHVFLAHPVQQGRLKGFDFYLMRNVESLRSVGVYLDTETRAYFPDFVLWAVGKDRTHILLIDPKGQSGIQDWHSLRAVNAKVALAQSRDLTELARKLTAEAGRRCKVDSFILLRKSSPLGRANGSLYDVNIVEEMQRRHVLHLNWAPDDEGTRLDEDGDALPVPPDGRCYLERMLTCAGVLNERK